MPDKKTVTFNNPADYGNLVTAIGEAQAGQTDVTVEVGTVEYGVVTLAIPPVVAG